MSRHIYSQPGLEPCVGIFGSDLTVPYGQPSGPKIPVYLRQHLPRPENPPKGAEVGWAPETFMAFMERNDLLYRPQSSVSGNVQREHIAGPLIDFVRFKDLFQSQMGELDPEAAQGLTSSTVDELINAQTILMELMWPNIGIHSQRSRTVEAGCAALREFGPDSEKMDDLVSLLVPLYFPETEVSTEYSVSLVRKTFVAIWDSVNTIGGRGCYSTCEGYQKQREDRARLWEDLLRLRVQASRKVTDCLKWGKEDFPFDDDEVMELAEHIPSKYTHSPDCEELLDFRTVE